MGSFSRFRLGAGSSPEQIRNKYRSVQHGNSSCLNSPSPYVELYVTKNIAACGVFMCFFTWIERNTKTVCKMAPPLPFCVLQGSLDAYIICPIFFFFVQHRFFKYLFIKCC